MAETRRLFQSSRMPDDWQRWYATFGELSGALRNRLARYWRRRYAPEARPGERWPTLEQVRALTDAELLAIPGFGVGSLQTLRDFLARHPATPGPLPDWLGEE